MRSDYRVTKKHFALLMKIVLRDRNTRRKQQRVFKRRKPLIKILRAIPIENILTDYLDFIIGQVSNEPTTYTFHREKLGHLQVLEVPSKKGYVWDKIYGSRDWVLTWVLGYSYMKVAFSPKAYKKILENGAKGKEYMKVIQNPELEIRKMLRNI